MTARSDGAIRMEGRSNQVGGQYTLEVVNAYGRTSRPIYIRWNEACKILFLLISHQSFIYFHLLARPQDNYGM